MARRAHAVEPLGPPDEKGLRAGALGLLSAVVIGVASTAPACNSYTSWLLPFWPHWLIGGAFVIAFFSALAGLAVLIYCRIAEPRYFRGETLNAATPTLAPEPEAPH